jgi:hypothetical protein
MFFINNFLLKIKLKLLVHPHAQKVGDLSSLQQICSNFFLGLIYTGR